MDAKSIANAIEYYSMFESNSSDEGEINYEDKLKEYSRIVYGCNYSGEPRPTKKLKTTIDGSSKKPKSYDMNGDIDNIILVAVSYFGLPSFMADRAKLIMARMWSHPDNFHDLKYENVALGILMYVVYEVPNEIVTANFNRYCTYMFGITQAKRNIRQMYEAYGIVCYSYLKVEQELR